MKIRTTILVGVIGLLILIGAWGTLSFWAARAEQDRARSADQLMSSFNLARQLKQSSDDLTRMSRLYVSTGDPLYRNYFERIVAIRSGQQPRPAGYDGSYWDEVLSGAKSLNEEGQSISLRRLMEQHGFTATEFTLLKESEDNSNDLVHLEQLAMNAVEGRFADEFGNFTLTGEPDLALARSLMFGSEYHNAKGEILAPIAAFDRQIELRLRAEMEQLHQRSLNLAYGQVIIALVTGISMLASLFYLRRAVLKPLDLLIDDAQTLRNRDYSTRVKIRRQDEMGELGSTFNEMAEAISEDIASREQTAHELRRAKALADEAVRSKSEFLANMSHEIRTPMNGIMGMTDLLLGTNLKPEQHDYVNLISQSSNSLLTVINDILDFSKIEAGKLSLDPHEFDLRDSIGDTLQTLSFRAAEKGLELAYQVQSNVPDCLIGDLGRIRQVIVNLVSNAIKFTAEGEVLVDVQLESQTSDQVSLHVLVHDTGIGISAEKQQAVFESFTQAEGSTTRTYGGTGLGLTISQRLVEMMKGRIWVESSLGVGSTFQFTALLGLGDEDHESQRACLETLHALPVLIVDDNDTNRKILRQMLLNWEMKPHTAESGAQALEQLANAAKSEQPIKLVLLDMMMPEMNGLEVAQCIAEEYGKNAPEILVLTSAGKSVQAEEAAELGIERTLGKPIKQSDLLDAIARMFGTSNRDGQGAEADSGTRADKAMKVLLAEDGRVNQMVAIKLLEKRGHSVVLAEDGQIATELHAKQSFDAILMDIQMPRLDGYGATKLIREREQQSGKHIPIIAMTANAMKGDRERCLAAGMDNYVAKPVRSEELYSVLEQYAPAECEAANEAGVSSLAASEMNSKAKEGIAIFESTRFKKQMGDPQLIAELLELFPAETETMLKRARQAVEAGDSQELHAAAHALKGTVGSYCAPRAHQALTALDQLARSGDLSQAADALARCKHEIEQLQAALAKYRKTLP